MTVRVVKENAEYFAEIICSQFNETINSSKFPLSFKLGNITPVFKNQSRNHKSNDRPVSILPLISKVFEKSSTNSFPYILKKFFQNSSVVFAKVSEPNIVPFCCLKKGNGLLIKTKFLERF